MTERGRNRERKNREKIEAPSTPHSQQPLQGMQRTKLRTESREREGEERGKKGGTTFTNEKTNEICIVPG